MINAALMPAPREPELSNADREALRSAVFALERNTLAQQMAVMMGRQVGFAGRVIPLKLQETATAAATTALRAALRTGPEKSRRSPRWTDK